MTPPAIPIRAAVSNRLPAISLIGGGVGGLRELAEHLRMRRRNLIVLPRPFDLMPAAIAARLIDKGIHPETPLYALQRLTLPDESVAEYSIASLAAQTAEFSDLIILVFPAGE